MKQLIIDKTIRSFLILLVFTISCKKAEVQPSKGSLKTISFDFESTLSQWIELGGSGERKFEGDISISDEFASVGAHSCKFTVSPESVVANGNRAELTFDQQAVEGEVAWYEWSFLIPEDYPDVPLKDNNGAPNWQVIGQWHQQPVFAEGEDWNNFTGQGSSPPVAVYYNYFAAGDLDYQAARSDPATQEIFGYNPDWDEVATITISYGLKSIAVSEIKKGEWVHLKINIRWSENEDGYIQVWQDGKEITNGKTYGANMLNKASHYFKFGLYRNPSIAFSQTLYYDEVKIW